MQCEARSLEHKVPRGVALQRGRAQVLFLDNDSEKGSHEARTQGPGWRTAHASSVDEYKVL
jgi:hypothetical protein